ncbi:hypothetical protein [Myxococcus sp. AB056]|uniref:hypothetical protein n=1 Tax=Myxococcus sp. AB056 TaxID=2562792 RepID=UPI001890EE52|nr:hypothetical protein [Myxococcus sp. AB056]
MMPKGVEHSMLEIRTVFFFEVPLAVMPKGVEHISAVKASARSALGARRPVPLAVMPKGVEHSPTCAGFRRT